MFLRYYLTVTVCIYLDKLRVLFFFLFSFVARNVEEGWGAAGGAIKEKPLARERAVSQVREKARTVLKSWLIKSSLLAGSLHWLNHINATRREFEIPLGALCVAAFDLLFFISFLQIMPILCKIMEFVE